MALDLSPLALLDLVHVNQDHGRELAIEVANNAHRIFMSQVRALYRNGFDTDIPGESLEIAIFMCGLFHNALDEKAGECVISSNQLEKWLIHNLPMSNLGNKVMYIISHLDKEKPPVRRHPLFDPFIYAVIQQARLISQADYRETPDLSAISKIERDFFTFLTFSEAKVMGREKIATMRRKLILTLTK